ncbi:MAG: tyrosine-type recombinase/integrase [Clostridiales bacterium]|nr:tyrosine-type recombinase/integrase [Clostridiales bacterium]
MKDSYSNDCPEYLKSFLNYLVLVKDRADRTEEAYYIDIRSFLRFIKISNGLVSKNCEYTDITISDVPISYMKKFTLSNAYDYLGYLKTVRNNSTATRARKTSALKQFFNYLHKKASLISKNPLVDLELPRVKNKLPKFLSLEESLKLLRNIESKYQERDYCMLVLFLNCGMRLSELVGLDKRDYSKDNHTLRLFGKGRKERIIYLNESCIDALEAYLEVRKNVETEPNALFLSRNNKRIDKRRVQQIVEENLTRAGLGNLGVTTHKLRHTAATLMYQHGNVDTLVLKEILGHKSIATTEIYTHLSSESLKKAAESSPLANVKNENIKDNNDGKK